MSFGYRDARIVKDSVVKYDDKTVDVYIDVEEGKKYYISDINWVGNSVYPTEAPQQCAWYISRRCLQPEIA